jgi:hypothetical protein
VLPGVEALLVALAARANCVTGLVRRHLRRRPHAVLTRFAQVTGNLEPIGWAKMEALGLKRHFSKPLVGGCAPLRCVWTRRPLTRRFCSFSSDYCSNQLADHSIDRAEFIRVAARKAAGALSGGTARVVHFGDTPNDIKAAAAAGALPVALATGAFTVAQLRQAAQAAGVGATTIVLDDLRNTAAVLKAMGV